MRRKESSRGATQRSNLKRPEAWKSLFSGFENLVLAPLVTGFRQFAVQKGLDFLDVFF
jgi:hypothetical protein